MEHQVVIILLPPLAWQEQTEASSKRRAREFMSNTDKAFLNHAESLVVNQYHAVAIGEPSPEIKMAQSVVMQSTVTRFAVPIYDSWMSHGLRSVRLLRLKTLYATYATCNLTMANHIDQIHHSLLSSRMKQEIATSCPTDITITSNYLFITAETRCSLYIRLSLFGKFHVFFLIYVC